MKLTVTFLALSSAVMAQDIAPKDSERDPILSALLDAGESNALNGPSITVDLDSSSDSDAKDTDSPILVTGNPPVDAMVAADEPSVEEDPGGVLVQVEAGTSFANVDASEIKLLAPFPAKPLGPPPSGWKLVHPDDSPPFKKEVELASGSSVTLTIRPHLLVPDADGDAVFSLREPGFDPAAHYAQKETIGAVLADSIMSLDANSDRLSAAAKRLDELLTSLPAPAPKASPISQP